MNILVGLDKVLGTLGQNKTRKGFAVTALSSLLLLVFPDMPEDSLIKALDLVVELINICGQIWLTIGVLHAWAKAKLVALAVVPPSVQAQVDSGKAAIIVVPSSEQ